MRRGRAALGAALAAALLACGGAPAPAPADDGIAPPSLPSVPALPLACPALYADDALPTFELELAEADWAALRQDLVEGEEVYYPAVFRHAGETFGDARVRLRGNNSRCGEKLQLAISFNEVHPDARYRGLRRLDLDHGGCRVLEERLALSYLRDLGVPAACANHARLVVNGRYQGLFLSVEHVNKDFLRRNFGSAANDGNLYKSGWRLRTNEEVNDTSDLEAYRAATDAAALAALVDLDEAVLAWAAEAVLPARDNYWLYGWNYYLYHHPERGFLFVPTDLDQAFPGSWGDVALATLEPDPLQPAAAIALADPAWRARYGAALRRALDAYDPDALAERLHRWAAQVAGAAAEDPFLPPQGGAADALEARIRERAAWLRATLEAAGP